MFDAILTPRSSCDLETAFARLQAFRPVSRRAFDLYVQYEVLPTYQDSWGTTLVRTSDLESFAGRHPSGVSEEETEDLCSVREAHAACAAIDPQPVSLEEFRELINVGIVRAVYTSDLPQAPLLGVPRTAIAAFLALRQRLLERLEEKHALVKQHDRIGRLSEQMTSLLRAKRFEEGEES